MDGTRSSRHYLRHYSPSVLSFIDDLQGSPSELLEVATDGGNLAAVSDLLSLGVTPSSQAISHCLLFKLSWGLDLWSLRLANTLKSLYLIQRHFGLVLTQEACSTLRYTVSHPHNDLRYAPYLIDLLPSNSPATLEQLAVYRIRLMCQGQSVPARYVIRDLPLPRMLRENLIGEL